MSMVVSVPTREGFVLGCDDALLITEDQDSLTLKINSTRSKFHVAGANAILGGAGTDVGLIQGIFNQISSISNLSERLQATEMNDLTPLLVEIFRKCRKEHRRRMEYREEEKQPHVAIVLSYFNGAGYPKIIDINTQSGYVPDLWNKGRIAILGYPAIGYYFDSQLYQDDLTLEQAKYLVISILEETRRVYIEVGKPMEIVVFQGPEEIEFLEDSEIDRLVKRHNEKRKAWNDFYLSE